MAEVTASQKGVEKELFDGRGGFRNLGHKFVTVLRDKVREC